MFAVATLDTVYVYDTQHLHPIAALSGLHYDKYTDVAWSADGNTLMVASTDGYCSLIAFAPGELGTPIADAGGWRPPQHQPPRGRAACVCVCVCVCVCMFLWAMGAGD